VLSRLNSAKMVRKFDMVENDDLEPVWSVYDYPFYTCPMTSVDKDFNQMGVPRLVASLTSGQLHIFSLMVRRVGRTWGFMYTMLMNLTPALFTLKISAIFVSLIQGSVAW
jgi:hypothetical protein